MGVLVNHLGRYRRLVQCFAIAARPLSAYMLLNGKHAQGVIELLVEPPTHALKETGARALAVLQFVMDQDGVWPDGYATSATPIDRQGKKPTT